MRTCLFKLLLLTILACGALAPRPATAQTISYTGGNYTENFDNLGPAGTSLAPGWWVGYAGPTNVTIIGVSDGSAAPDGTAGWNFGSSGGADRAPGTMATSTGSPAPNDTRWIEARFRNNSGQPFTNLTVFYDGEQWRAGSANTVNILVMRVSVDGVNYVNLGSSFDFVQPTFTPFSSALDGNQSTNRTPGLGGTFSLASPLPPGGTLFLRWFDANETGTDPALAIDNFSFAAASAPPPPPTVALTSPANGASFLAGDNATVTAAAQDASGVAFVDFFVNGGFRFRDTNAPFSITEGDLTAGTQTLLAVSRGNGGLNATSAPVNITVTNEPGVTVLVANGSMWKYLDDGSDQGTNWRAPGFNDSGWSNGVAELGFGDGSDNPPRPERTVINGGPTTNRNATTYFRHTFNVADPSAYSALVVRLLRDDGGVAYLNGVEVFRSNMPTGAVNYATLTGVNAPDDGTTYFDSTNLSPALLVAGPNVLAVEIHQSALNSSDLSFDGMLLAQLLPSCAPSPSGLTSWWPGEGNANDLAGANHGTIQGSVSFGSGIVGSAFKFNGSTSWVDFGTGPSITGQGPFAVEAWIQSTQTTVGAVLQQRDANEFNGQYQLWLIDGRISWYTYGDFADGFGITSSRTVNDGGFHHIVGTREADGTGKLYIDGVLDSSQAAPPRTLVPIRVYVGADVRDYLLANTPRFFNGTIDEVSIYGRALPPSEVAGLYAAGSAGKCSPPVITSQPRSQCVAAGQGVTFDVVAVGNPAPTYQWKKNGTIITAAFSSTFTIPVVSSADAGDYTVEVSNSAGSVLSSVATLTVGLAMTNPSFEVDTFTNFPGYVSGNFPITGWTALPEHGINPGVGFSPFADNGAIPHGTQVAFLQEAGAMSQMVSGFTVGAAYHVEYYENARNCCSGTLPSLEVKIGGNTIVAAHPVPPVGGGNPYHRVISSTFTATASSLELAFIKSNPQGGDTTALIDNVCIVRDTTPNCLTLNCPNVVVEACPPQPGGGTIVNYPTPTVVNGCSGTVKVGCSPYAGQIFPLGTTPVTCYAVDNLGNQATCTFTVTVNPGPKTTRAWNTGMGGPSGNVPLAPGATDLNYTLASFPAGGCPGPAQAIDPSSIPGAWLQNSPESKWIGPAQFVAPCPAGVYRYHLEFYVPCTEGASLVGRFTADDAAGLYLNGVPIINSAGYNTWTPVNITSGFVAGAGPNAPNVLDIWVTNALGNPLGWTGLRAELTNSFSACCGCVPPPAGMVLWLPLDETTYSTAFNASAPFAGSHVGSVIVPSANPNPSYVGNAVYFPGVNNNPNNLDHVAVPSYPAIEFSTGDFSFDAWIKPNNAQRVETILSKFDNVTQQGYAFYIYPVTANSGILAARLGDGGPQDYINLGSSVPIGVWSHVAVTVKRGAANGVVAYVNGQAGNTPGTAPSGTLFNSRPLWLGEDEASVNPPPGFPILSDMRGEIDEVELFNRALRPVEVESIYVAGHQGKCKHHCHVPWDSPFCKNQNVLSVTAYICNSTTVPQTYNYWFSGLPPGPGCAISGPTAFATPANTVPPTPAGTTPSVAPGTCVPVTVSIDRPAGMTAKGLVGCYIMGIQPVGSTEIFSCVGSVQDARQTCVKFMAPLYNALNLSPVDLGPVTFTNTSDGDLTLRYQVVVMTPEMGMDDSDVSLNGQPAGAAPTNTLVLARGQGTTIGLTAQFLRYQPGRFYTILIQADTDDDGLMEPLASTALRNVIGAAEPPKLSATVSGTNIVLSWCGCVSDFSPEESAALGGTNTVWTHVTNAPVIVEGNNHVTLPRSHPQRFYRLRGPAAP